MTETALTFLRGELSAAGWIIAAGVVVLLAAAVLLVTGLRLRGQAGGGRWRLGLGSALVVFGALALVGGLSYRSTVQGLLDSVPQAIAVDARAAAAAELERMTVGVDRLQMLVRVVWPVLIAGGLALALLLRRRARATAGVALGVALGSVLTLSIDLLGIDRSDPYKDRLTGYVQQLETTG